MKSLRQRRKEKRKKQKKKDNPFWDAFIDSLLWIPDILLFPFRILYYVIRAFGRLFKSLIEDIGDLLP